MGKFILRFVSCLLVILFATALFSKGADAFTDKYCFIEERTGWILYAANERTRVAMASTTKIVTALIALENGESDMPVKVSRKASITEGSSAYLKEGDIVTLYDLVVLCLMRSANDASVAIAEAVCPTEEEFVGLMNSYVFSLGLEDTHFENSHGLDEENHYSCAYDLAVIMNHAVKNETLMEILSAEYANVRVNSIDQKVINKTKSQNTYVKAMCAKNGYTENAGRCLISVAESEGMRISGCVLNAENIYLESETLFEKCFENYTVKKVIVGGEYIKTVAVENGVLPQIKLSFEKDFYIPVKSDGTTNYHIETTVLNKVIAPLERGAFLGQTVITADGGNKVCIEHSLSSDICEKQFYEKFFDYCVIIIKNHVYLP